MPFLFVYNPQDNLTISLTLQASQLNNFKCVKITHKLFA